MINILANNYRKIFIFLLNVVRCINICSHASTTGGDHQIEKNVDLNLIHKTIEH